MGVLGDEWWMMSNEGPGDAIDPVPFSGSNSVAATQ
jgi:hypothetical protein